MRLQSADALCAAAEQLPVPVVLEHVVRPLLQCLDRGPDAAVALVRIGGGLGAQLAARHLLEPLLGVLACSGTPHTKAAAVRQLRAGTLNDACKWSCKD